MCLDSVKHREHNGVRCWCPGEYHFEDQIHDADCFVSQMTLKEAHEFIERIGKTGVKDGQEDVQGSS